MFANIKKTIAAILVATGIVASLSFATVSAQTPAPTSGAPKCGSGISFFPTWYDGLCNPATGGIKSPGDPSLGADTSTRFGKWIGIIALNLVSMLLYVVGYVSLGYIIFGGFKYMTNGDNSSGTAAAKKTITNAVIGLVLSIMSVAIVKFIAMMVGG